MGRKCYGRAGLALSLLGWLGFAGCVGCSDESQTTSIEIDGSSTVYRLSVGVYEVFRETDPSIKVMVNYAGTGAGFGKFVEGKLDIVDASRPIQQNEIDLARKNNVEYIELPVAFDALTVAVNAGNDWCSEITVADLKKLWEPGAKDKVTQWNHLRPEWPEKRIALFGAGHDSGTFDYFTEAIVGKKGSIRSDTTATEDDNQIVNGVAGDKYALGYLPYAYYEPNKLKLKALKIDWKADDDVGAIEPSPQTVRSGQYNPLSRPLFIYVNKKAAERPEVQKFVNFYLKNAHKLAERLQYVPLPEQAYTMAAERFAKKQTGTGFGGHSEFGLPIEEILKREPKS